MVRPKDPDGIKSNMIITEVQKKPCLFDTNHPHYGDRAEKARCWEEVCSSVVPGWASRSPSEKSSAGKEVQKRWRSIRDSYTKAYRQGKCLAPGQCVVGSRRYHHQRQMEFLLLALQNKKPRYSHDKYDSHSSMSSSPQHQSPDELLTKIKREVVDKPLDLKTKPLDLKHKPHTADKACQTDPSYMQLTLPTCDSRPLTAGEKSARDENLVDDRAFATSLLPLFKNMDLDTKLLCRIEIMKIIRYALSKHERFKALGTAEDRFYEEKICSILTKEKSAPLKNENKTGSRLSMTTRSADGSRPIRKRKSYSSPSPPRTPAKRRGPGRPRKVPLPSSDSDRRGRLSRPGRVSPTTRSPNSVALDEALNKATSVAQLSTFQFMKVYNLGHSKDSAQPISMKTEPLDPAPQPTP